MIEVSKITKMDMELIYNGLSNTDKDNLKDKRILITGFAGSLGYTLLNFFYVIWRKAQN